MKVWKIAIVLEWKKKMCGQVFVKGWTPLIGIAPVAKIAQALDAGWSGEAGLLCCWGMLRSAGHHVMDTLPHSAWSWRPRRRTWVLVRRDLDIVRFRLSSDHVTCSLAGHVTSSLAGHATSSLASYMTSSKAGYVTSSLAGHVTSSLAGLRYLKEAWIPS